MKEEWRAIKGYENLYEVSSLGRVRSLDRIIQQKSRWSNAFYSRKFKGRILSLAIGTSGYYAVSLSKAGTGSRMYDVHRLLASAFLEKTNESFEVCHYDGNKLNNSLKNLRWEQPQR